MGKEKNEWTLKIFALLIAIILWTYVMSEVDPRISENFNVEVRFLNESSLERQGLVVLEPENATVRVRVSGRRSEIIKIKESDILAQVDLSGYSEGKVKVPVYVQAPGSVTIDDYSPREILITFDRIITREMPVTVETTGQVPEGVVLGTPEVKPQYVAIEGPRTWLNSVWKVIATVDVSQSTNDINVTRPIRIVDDEGNEVRGIYSNINVVDISIPVYNVKTVPIELRTENQLPESYEIVDITIIPSTVSIIGKKDVLQNINQINTQAVDILELMNNENVTVDLDIPEGVRLAEGEGQVTVTLNVEDIITKTLNFTLENVNILNLSPGLSIAEESMNKTFSITIKGRRSIVEALEAEDIELILDLQGLGEGSHNVEITVKEEEFILLTISPESIQVDLNSE
ncbi:MAG: hypothetical protein GX069_09635 [Tissierellia bacterium]|nr:hypothetical protein [Tissierellia bacterium]